MTTFLPSITSHSTGGSSTWRSKISELRALGISECALFVTGMSQTERFECYEMLRELKRQHRFRVPFVHAVTSMSEAEYWFLVSELGAEKFNLHPRRQFPLEHALSEKLRGRIFIENSYIGESITAADVEGFAGICLDLSHFEALRCGAPELGKQLEALLGRHVIGANHLSAVGSKYVEIVDNVPQISSHRLTTDADLTYAANIPGWMFAEYCAIELEDSLADQLTALEKLRALLPPPLRESRAA